MRGNDCPECRGPSRYRLALVTPSEDIFLVHQCIDDDCGAFTIEAPEGYDPKSIGYIISYMED